MRDFNKIVKDVAQLKWSTVILEESFSEVEEAVKLAIKQANSFIFGLADFPFRYKKGGTMNASGAFAAPNGNICDIWLADGRQHLTNILPQDSDLLDMSFRGTPQKYWLDFGDDGAVIHLWPVPDKTYTVFYRYINACKAKDAAGNEKFNLEEQTDVVNLPDNPVLEDYYMHCLYTKAMVYLIADEQDENYRPYEKEFLEAYHNLLSYSGMQMNPKLVI